MHSIIERFLTWAPRAGSIAFASALPVIGVRTFGHVPHDAENIIALVMHLLLSAVVLILVYSAWQREWIGWAGAFSLVGFYFWTNGAAVPWNDTTLIAGGLPILGMLYAWNAERHRRRSRAVAGRPDPVIPRPSGKVEEYLQKRNSGKHAGILDFVSGTYAHDTL